MIKRQTDQIGKIESVLDNYSGFYSQLFLKLNHFIYAKKNKLDFTLKVNNWLYTYETGWVDYFKPVELTYEINKDKS